MKKFFILLFIFFVFSSSSAFAQEKARINSFSPNGVVKGVKQVKVFFSEQMVPFGDPRTKVEPFDIHCEIQGISRWVDPKNYVYEFHENLPAGISCTFILKKELKTLAGKELEGEKKFSFSTGGPAIVNSNPYEGSSITEDQIFILDADSELDLESVEKNLLFSVSGLKDLAKGKIITGNQSDEILKSQGLKKSPTTILIQSQMNFPNGSNVSLIWGKGIKSKTGVPTANPQTLSFNVRQSFNAQFSCERENPNAGCIPITPMYLNFTSPILWKFAKQIRLKSGNQSWNPKKYSDEDDPNFTSSIQFTGPFPQSTKFKIEIPQGIKDDSGRSLENQKIFPLEVKTEKFPPLAKFSAKFGIIEKNAEPVLPVTLRNIEKDITVRMNQTKSKNPGFFDHLIGKKTRISSDEILFWLKRISQADREKSIFENIQSPEPFRFPKPNGAEAFEVVGIPLKESGFYVVEIESASLGKSLIPEKTPMYVPTSALVTNMSVHLKWGREGSVVWVTSLDKGLPIADAKISIRDCNNKIIGESKTDFFGIARLTDSAWKGQVAHCSYRNYDSGILVTAETKDDFSFVHSSWDKGIESWRYDLSSYSNHSKSIVPHTILDRTLFRAGETVSMKNLIRHASMKGLSQLQEELRPKILRIRHEGSNEKFFFNLKWNKSGDSELEWKIPKEAKLGMYSITLLKNKTDYSGWDTSEFRVEEFRVPLMKGVIQPSKTVLINPKEFTIDVFVQYLSGGGAGNLPVKIRSFVSNLHYGHFENFEGFSFSSGSVKEGRTRSSSGYDDENYDESGTKISLSNLTKKELILDNSGSARVVIDNLPKVKKPSTVSLEMEYRDPNGEMQTVSSNVSIYPSNYLIGIKPSSWTLTKDSSKVSVAVVNIKGKPIPNTQVSVEVFERKIFSHRKRLVGGFYAYENYHEIKKVGSFCEGKTDKKGTLQCSGKSPIAGSVIFQAKTLDESGRETSTNQEVWIASQKNLWFSAEDSDRMDLLPEKKSYNPGETARFQVRTPFQNALALITIEREGVMESYVRNLSSQSPVIDVPIRKNYTPNVYVSVLAVRGRAGNIQPTALVDLGRPTYRLGISKIKVGWKENELKVSVQTKKSVYGIREKVTTKVQVKNPDGKPVLDGEVAIAAVDEGLLELSPNRTWDVLTSMMQERAYEVKTATAQMQVVGRRHFGLKATPPGGGGGNQTTRELFDTLLFWKSKVPLNSKGEAEVEIPLNDSLTKFRIVAIATSRSSLFGNGNTSIRTSQDLMLLSGISPIAREEDKFTSEFTLRNASEREMDVSVDAITKEIPSIRLHETHKLKSGEAKVIHWKIKVPIGIEFLTYEISAKENSGKSDKLRIKQKIVETIPVRTYQSTISRLEKEYSLKVEMPSDSIDGRGGVNLAFKKSLSEGLQGVRDYMQKYPYSCLEQEISKSIVLRDPKRWEEITRKISSYLDSDGFAKYFPSSYFGSEILTSYVLTISHDVGWDLPESSLNRMLGALERFAEGSLYRRSDLQTADLTMRKLAAIEALSKFGRAKFEYLSSIQIEPNLWPTSTLIDWWNILYRMKNFPERETRIREVEDILRSRMNLQGTVMNFSSDSSDYLWWLMVSPDVNSARLLSTLVEQKKWAEDIPRIARGVISRQKKGRWDTTTANAYGVLAMEKFSREFEKITISGKINTSLGDEKKSVEWNQTNQEEKLAYPYFKGQKELSVKHDGTGNPWMIIQSNAAIPLKSPLFAGYKIEKTLVAIEQKISGKWSKGDVVKIKLKIHSDSSKTWVVVSDPIPSGSSILGTGLVKDSLLFPADQNSGGWLAYEEKSFENYRAYYQYLPEGVTTIEYTLRLNQEGLFKLPATRIEAMYFPEMFGELPNQEFTVGK